MKDKLRMYRTYTLTETACLPSAGHPTALAAYAVSAGRLIRPRTIGFSFTVMCVDASKFRPEGSHRVLASEIVREAIVRGCSGVLIDLPFSRSAASFCSFLAASCSANGLDLYLPEALAALTKTAKALIRTTICAGSFVKRLEDTARKFSAERIALDAGLLRAEFTLPSPNGAGRLIEADELRILRDNCFVFHSKNLCADCIIRFVGNDVRFILFDSKSSFHEKLRTAERLGITECFVRAADYGELS